MVPYKKSRFNFTYKQSDDAYVVFNTYSKALVVLNSCEFKQFEDSAFDIKKDAWVAGVGNDNKSGG